MPRARRRQGNEAGCLAIVVLFAVYVAITAISDVASIALVLAPIAIVTAVLILVAHVLVKRRTGFDLIGWLRTHAVAPISRLVARRRRPPDVIIIPEARGYSTPGVREYIPPRVRFAVLQRDGFRCVYCGRTPQHGISLELDHVIPVSAGGRTEADNLVASCEDCNRSKHAKQVIH